MSTTRITINGRHYESPDAMPADVRRQYDEAMRAIGPSLTAGPADSTRFHANAGGLGVNTQIVVNKTITVNDRKFGSVEELPPEMRQLVENALRGQGVTAGAPSGAGVQMTVESGKPRFSTFINVSGSAPHGSSRPVEPSSVSPEARRFVWDLAFWVALGLLFWFWLGR